MPSARASTVSVNSSRDLVMAIWRRIQGMIRPPAMIVNATSAPIFRMATISVSAMSLPDPLLWASAGINTSTTTV